MTNIIVADGPVKFRMQVVLRCVGQVNGGRYVNRLCIGVIGKEAEVMRDDLAQANGSRVVDLEADWLDVQNEAERRRRRLINRQKELFATAGN